ncbi:MAG: epimerase, partial [Pseudomonadota bacterium]
GWNVRLFDRSTDDLMRASDGVDVIVNGWNTPYTDWETLVPRLTEQVIRAAEAGGATVILPGNVYNFGVGAPGLLTETTPHAAINPLGRVRTEMEAAYRASTVQTIVLRAGDFIDTEASGNWFDLVITAKVKRGTFTSPGEADAAHAWAYLPDLAKATVLLAEMRERLSHHEDVPFPGYTMTLGELRRHCEAALGRDLTLRDFPWWMIRIGGTVVPPWQKLVEMRYLWSKPHRLDDTRFAELLPGFRTTDPGEAIRIALGAEVDPHKAVPGRVEHVAAE